MGELPLSGERVIEDVYRANPRMYAIYLMHIASYGFAKRYTQGKRVLDLGCGSGYGAALIAPNADQVTAVDVSVDALRYAAEHHGHSNLDHELIRAGEALPFPDDTFDVVLSFQVIEHVDDDAKYIAEARRVLRKNGIFIVITPNRAVRLLPWQRPWNRWHVREYSAESLARLFLPGQFSVDMKFMTARGRVAELEFKRYHKLKWMLLPITLPVVIDPIRVRLLNMLHRLSARSLKVANNQESIDFDESEINFSDVRRGALNLVVIAKKVSA